MPLGDSFAGITVPDGDPEGVRSAGQAFVGIAGSLERVAAGLGSLPGGLAAWEGPASVTFGATTASVTDAVVAAGRAFDVYVPAVREAADAAPCSTPSPTRLSFRSPINTSVLRRVGPPRGRS